MARVKRGLVKRKRHKKILKNAKGYTGARSKLVRVAHEAVMHAGQYAFAGRKLRKRDKRREWIVRINALLRSEGTSYNKFINDLSRSKVELDRKILADIAVNDPDVFKQIVKKVSNP